MEILRLASLKTTRPYLERLERRELLDNGTAGIAYGQIPLSFEANQGQTDPAVQFLSHGSGYALFLTSQEAVLSLSKPVTPAVALTGAAAQPTPVKDVLRVQLLGANTAPHVTGVDRLSGTSNYFIGSDRAQWRTNVPTFGKVLYQDVYRGIDLVYYGNQQQLEYDFVVAPGANPGVIGLAFEGAQEVTLDSQGNLVLRTSGGDVVEHAPVVYQDRAAGRQTVEGHYVLMGQSRVGFEVGAYDTTRPLVIDPVLSYSTYLGGSGVDMGTGIAVDASGNAYVSGSTNSTFDFPKTVGAVQTTYGGGSDDAFVAKLNATGTALLYITYLGGSGKDSATSIALDAAGDAYITGSTNSPNFPTTPGSVQASYGSGFGHAFVAELNSIGTALVYSTYLGGSRSDAGNGIALDGSGTAYVTGWTNSPDFPTTAGALQRTLAGHGPSYSTDGFVARLNESGTGLLFATYLGGNDRDEGRAIALDNFGNAWVTGLTSSRDFPTTPAALQGTYWGGSSNAFVAKLSTTGTALLYATYVPEGQNGAFGNGIAVDVLGDAYIAGTDISSDGLMGGFVLKLNAMGVPVDYNVSFGSSNGFSGGATCVALDAFGNVYFASGGGQSSFVEKDLPSGARVYSVYLAGKGNQSSNAIAVDALGNAYLTGYTSAGLPITRGAIENTFGGGLTDAFVMEISSPDVTIQLSSSASPSTYGQPVVFTATVASTGGPIHTGTVTFKDGSTILASSVPLDSHGRATFQIATLTAADSPHAITAFYNGGPNPNLSSNTIVQRVSKAVLRVTADDKTKLYGQPNPPFTATYSGFVLGQDPSVLGGTLAFSTPATTTSPVGSYTITPSGLTSTNYAITFVNGTLTITGRELKAAGIDFAATVNVAQDFTVAQFTDSDPSAHLGVYAVLIDFGDGTPTQPGTVTQPGRPGTAFFVHATHTYTQIGTFTVHVQIFEETGTSAQTFSTATVGGPGAPQRPGRGRAGILGNGPSLVANGDQVTDRNQQAETLTTSSPGESPPIQAYASVQSNGPVSTTCIGSFSALALTRTTGRRTRSYWNLLF